MKVCKKCGISKDLKKFKSCEDCVDGRRNTCRKCLSQRPTFKITKRAYQLKKYKMSISDYDFLLAKQNGMCAICGTTNPGKGLSNFPVDHDHFTGEVRGLLCYSCNIALGHFKDSQQSLYSAITYLQRRS